MHTGHLVHSVEKCAGALVLALLAGGCASDPSPPAAQPPPACPSGTVFIGGQCQAAAPPAGAGGTSSAPPTTTGTVPQGAGGTAIHQTTPGSDAVRLDASAASGAAQLLGPVLAGVVPDGARPVGELVAGQFTQGQSLREPVTLKPGACYTVVAVALAPVTEVDVALIPALPIPGFNPTAAKDPETGLLATIGKKPNCFKWALPAEGTMTLILTVPGGQGVAAAQLYEKR
jgi:hypothetical protein